jgi:hypothetical protein
MKALRWWSLWRVASGNLLPLQPKHVSQQTQADDVPVEDFHGYQVLFEDSPVYPLPVLGHCSNIAFADRDCLCRGNTTMSTPHSRHKAGSAGALLTIRLSRCVPLRACRPGATQHRAGSCNQFDASTLKLPSVETTACWNTFENAAFPDRRDRRGRDMPVTSPGAKGAVYFPFGTASGLNGCGFSQADSRLRPRARRAERTARPPLVAMRERKP